MSSAHSMNARKCVHAQKPNPSQAFVHMNQARSEQEKNEKKRERIEKQRPGG